MGGGASAFAPRTGGFGTDFCQHAALLFACAQNMASNLAVSRGRQTVNEFDLLWHLPRRKAITDMVLKCSIQLCVVKAWCGHDKSLDGVAA